MQHKFKVGIIGATGMVGQKFISLLAEHPWFEVTKVAASPNSAGKTYAEAVLNRWSQLTPIPQKVANLIVEDASQVEKISAEIDFVFCAVDMPKSDTVLLEEAYAKRETPVISNNSACRMLADVPMLIPEINPDHAQIISVQQARLKTKRGFIAVKPNCSLQSYLPAIFPLLKYQPSKIIACTYQAISGAGKNFTTWPEMLDNVIPFIKGEEEKTEQEPLKILGSIVENKIVAAKSPIFSAQCIRVPVLDGHMAAVYLDFTTKPSFTEIIEAWNSYQGKPQQLKLPSAPKQFLQYFTEDNRPQTRLDRDRENGMGISIGRLRTDTIFPAKFVCLSHNTIRGAAGGAILIAELLAAEGYLTPK